MVKSRKISIEKLEEDIDRLIKILNENMDTTSPKYTLDKYPTMYAMFCDINVRASNLFPDHETFCTIAVQSRNSIGSALGSLLTLSRIIKREKEIENEIVDRKLFLGAEDKLKLASKSFENQDYTSTFNNLNSALELALKDILDIPLTITKINTSDIINIMVKNKLGPTEHLKEVQKHVLSIDNKTKHQGYNPTKIDSINAIKSMEEVISKLKKSEIKINDEIKNKIYSKI